MRFRVTTAHVLGTECELGSADSEETPTTQKKGGGSTGGGTHSHD